MPTRCVALFVIAIAAMFGAGRAGQPAVAGDRTVLSAATELAAIEVSGYIVPAGPDGTCREQSALDSVDVGQPIIACWVATNTGAVPFGSHELQEGLGREGDANAPYELLEAIGPGETLQWTSGVVTAPSQPGSLGYTLWWRAFESDLFGGRAADGYVAIDVDVVDPDATVEQPRPGGGPVASGDDVLAATGGVTWVLSLVASALVGLGVLLRLVGRQRRRV